VKQRERDYGDGAYHRIATQIYHRAIADRGYAVAVFGNREPYVMSVEAVRHTLTRAEAALAQALRPIAESIMCTTLPPTRAEEAMERRRQTTKRYNQKRQAEIRITPRQFAGSPTFSGVTVTPRVPVSHVASGRGAGCETGTGVTI
jgi:hypothetical protein